METNPISEPGKEITLKKALIILAAVIIVISIIGIGIGYAFFWNQHDTRTSVDYRMEAAKNRLKEEPDNPMAHASIGLEYLRQQKYEMAVKELENACELDDENLGFKFSLGLAYNELEEWDKAQPLFEKVIEKNPFHFLAHVNLGVVYHNKKEYEKAVKSYNNALLLKKAAADVLLLRAETYEEMGERELALEDVNQALQYVPDYQDAIDFKQKLKTK